MLRENMEVASLTSVPPSLRNYLFFFLFFSVIWVLHLLWAAHTISGKLISC